MNSDALIKELIKEKGYKNFFVKGLCLDSRKVRRGYIFFALEGNNFNGSDFIDDAVKRGAALVLKESKNSKEGIYVPNLKKYMGLVATRFYGNPSSRLKVIAVTGTNGKTTCVESTSYLLSKLNIPCGYMGTISNSLDGKKIRKASMTTNHIIDINKFLSLSQSKGATFFALEASSHGLKQDRLSGLDISTAILTSFSQDHLDYHSSIEDYMDSKSKLFTELKPKQSVIQIDNSLGNLLVNQLQSQGQKIISVSQKDKTADFFFSIKNSKNSIEIFLKTREQTYSFSLNTISKYLASNVICSLAALEAEGYSLKKLIEFSGSLNFPDGRMTKLDIGKAVCYIDYAHTPDGLRASLESLKDSGFKDIWCIFGCGGSRDKSKRSIMGSIAEGFCSKVILTNDNPRSEDQKGIIKQILDGFKDKSKVEIILDRKKAIRETIRKINAEDKEIAMLLAGKGHEDTQEIENKFLSFKDENIVLKAIQDQ